jgi:hypothetical protein
LEENLRFKNEVYSKLEAQMNESRKVSRDSKEEKMLIDSKMSV